MKSKFPSLEPLVPFYGLERPVNWEKVFGRQAPLEVEIGSGMGEFLVRKASEEKEVNFVGIEQLWERIYKTLQRISDQSNVKLLFADARDVFERLFVERSIQRMYCLFPCPWPKNSHEKHRLFSEAFLKLLNSRLKDRGELTIVTDWQPYYEWVLSQEENSGFEVKTQKINPKFNTKFERKWLSQGHQDFFEIHMFKKEHRDIPVKEDCAVKTYRLKEFVPEKFKIEDLKGEISVILKDKIYDPKEKELLLLTVVAEGHLAQYLWVSIRWEEDHWRLSKAHGQQFFPTPGVVKALEHIYQQIAQAVNN